MPGLSHSLNGNILIYVSWDKDKDFIAKKSMQMMRYMYIFFSFLEEKRTLRITIRSASPSNSSISNELHDPRIWGCSKFHWDHISFSVKERHELSKANARVFYEREYENVCALLF